MFRKRIHGWKDGLIFLNDTPHSRKKNMILFYLLVGVINMYTDTKFQFSRAKRLCDKFWWLRILKKMFHWN